MGGAEAVCGIFPVSNIPKLINIIWPDILILKVVSVFPNINTNDWNKSSGSLDYV